MIYFPTFSWRVDPTAGPPGSIYPKKCSGLQGAGQLRQFVDALQRWSSQDRDALTMWVGAEGSSHLPGTITHPSWEQTKYIEVLLNCNWLVRKSEKIFRLFLVSLIRPWDIFLLKPLASPYAYLLLSTIILHLVKYPWRAYAKQNINKILKTIKILRNQNNKIIFFWITKQSFTKLLWYTLN